MRDGCIGCIPGVVPLHRKGVPGSLLHSFFPSASHFSCSPFLPSLHMSSAAPLSSHILLFVVHPMASHCNRIPSDLHYSNTFAQVCQHFHAFYFLDTLSSPWWFWLYLVVLLFACLFSSPFFCSFPPKNTLVQRHVYIFLYLRWCVTVSHQPLLLCKR